MFILITYQDSFKIPRLTIPVINIPAIKIYKLDTGWIILF